MKLPVTMILKQTLPENVPFLKKMKIAMATVSKTQKQIVTGYAVVQRSRMNVEIVMEMVLQKIVQVLMNVKIWTVTVNAVEQRLLMNVVSVAVMEYLLGNVTVMEMWQIVQENAAGLQQKMSAVSVMEMESLWGNVIVMAMQKTVQVSAVVQKQRMTVEFVVVIVLPVPLGRN